MFALRCFEFLFALLDVFPRHSRSQEYVPVNEERLREVGFDTNCL